MLNHSPTARILHRIEEKRQATYCCLYALLLTRLHIKVKFLCLNVKLTHFTVQAISAKTAGTITEW